MEGPEQDEEEVVDLGWSEPEASTSKRKQTTASEPVTSPEDDLEAARVCPNS